METNIVVGWYFTTNPISGEMLVLELGAKMLSDNQIAGFFKMWYLKKEVKDQVYFWHVDKHMSSTSWYYRFGCVETSMPKVLKIRSLHNFAVSPEKHGWGGGGGKLIFCLQMNTKVIVITLGLHS